MLEKISNKIIAVGGAIVIIGGIVAYMGFQIQTPTDSLDAHVTQTNQTHTELNMKVMAVQKETEHLYHIESLLEGLLRGECLENPRENLARQGLLTKCKELGIER